MCGGTLDREELIVRNSAQCGNALIQQRIVASRLQHSCPLCLNRSLECQELRAFGHCFGPERKAQPRALAVDEGINVFAVVV